MFVFGNSPGVVGTAVTGPALPFAVTVGGNPGITQFPAAAVGKGVITGFRDAGESGLGVSHTLNDRIYFWVFGERAGTAEVSGFAFADTCGSGVDSNWSGFDVVAAYYERVRVSATGLPVRLVFGPRTARFGLLHKYRFSLDDPQTGLGTFAFEFTTIPNPSQAPFENAPLWLPWVDELTSDLEFEDGVVLTQTEADTPPDGGPVLVSDGTGPFPVEE